MDVSILKYDENNYNQGTEQGNAMIEKSIDNCGLGRSILIDKNNVIIAGNKTTEQANNLGIKNVRIIETDGTEIIAVKRTDLDINDKKAKELALFDNRTAELNLTWDKENLLKDFDEEELKKDFDLEFHKDFDGNIDDFFTENTENETKKEKLCPHCGKVIN